MASPVTHETNSGAGFNTTPVVFTFSTVQTSYVAILLVYNEHAGSAGATTTVTSTSGHTWTLRKRSNASTSGCLETYWTHGTTSPINATIAFSGAYDDYAVTSAIVTGCANPAAPFDANAGLPIAHSSTTVSWTPSFTGVNTSNANDLLLFLTGQAQTGGTPAAGFTTVIKTSTGAGSWAAGVQMDAQSVSVVQSGATFTFGSAVGAFGSAGEAIFDALAGTSPAPPYVPPPPPGNSGNKGGAKDKSGGKNKVGVPALSGEGWFEHLRGRERRRPHLAVFAPTPKAGPLAESAVTSAALAATVVHIAPLSASAATSDAIGAGKLLAAILAETAATSATTAASLTVRPALAESGHGADALSATAKMLAALAASAVTSDTPHHGDAFPGTLSESAVTSSAITAVHVIQAALAEGATANAAVAGYRTLVAALAEAGHGSDALAGKLGHGAFLAEGAATHDALMAAAKFLGSLAEGVTAQDGPAATAIFRAALTEAASTLDADRWLATTHPLRHAAKLIGERSTPNLDGEWREPGSG